MNELGKVVKQLIKAKKIIEKADNKLRDLNFGSLLDYCFGYLEITIDSVAEEEVMRFK